MTQESVTLDTREIRGLNIKMMITIVAAIISSTIAIMVTLGKMDTRQTRMESIMEKNYEMHDLKIRTLDIRITQIEQELRDMRRKSNDGE